MNLIAIHPAELFKCSWVQGCIVVLIGVWSFLALLGIRNARFPWRILGGVGFVVGSTLWLGLHPDLDFDTGLLGFAARKNLFEPLGSPLALSSLSALLLVCSVIGLLVAVDWLPLLPFAPMLARVDERNRRLAAEGADTNRAAPQPEAGPSLLMSRGTAATLAPSPEAVVQRPEPAPIAPTEEAFVAAAEPPPAPIASEPQASAADPEGAETAATSGPLGPNLEEMEDEEEVVTNWARFRPRLRDDEMPAEGPTSAPAKGGAIEPPNESGTAPKTGGDLPVDIGSTASHNSSTPEGESRADGELAAEAAAPDVKKEDAPVPDRDDEIPLTDAPSAPTAVAEPEEGDGVLEVDDPVASPSSADSEGETLAPRRKKEEEEEPAEEPGEPDDDDEEGDDEDEEGEEKEEDDEDADDEDWDDEDAEEEEDDELDDEEDEEEEKEEEEDEEEEDDAEEDEDWEEDDDEEDDDDDEEEEEDDEEKGKAPPAPSAEVEVLAASAEPAALPTLAPGLFGDLPDDERLLVARAAEVIAGTESVSLSRLQRELGVTYYSAARVFERLEKEGFVAPYTGSLARAVRLSREEWEVRRSGGRAS